MDFGVIYAADGFNFYETILHLIIIAFTLLIGATFLHYISLTLSPYPSMKITATGIHYKRVGTIGYAKVGWHGMRFGKRKGLFKHLYMQLMVPQRVKLNSSQNLIYKIAYKFLKFIFNAGMFISNLVALRFAKLIPEQYRTKPYNRNPKTIRIYRTTVGVPVSEIEELLDKHIDFYAPQLEASLAEKTDTNEPAVIRIRPKQWLKLGYTAIKYSLLSAIIVIPFLFIGLGYYSYQKDIRNDITTQQTQALRERALSGDADAQNKFGWRLSNGLGIPKSKSRAKVWYRRAADQGHMKAQYNVGISYKCTRKKKSNCRSALKWFRKAAGQGHALSQSKLGYFYYKGFGVKRSYENALYHFSHAAKQNHGYSLYFVGFMHEKGRGVKKSKVKAANYYNAAIEHGYSKAQKALTRVSK